MLCLAQPKSWIPAQDLIGSSSVLALDMVSDEISVYRLLAAISEPPKWAPSRSWCMHCKSPNFSSGRFLHCHHCGRHVCRNCARSNLSAGFFPKSFGIIRASPVCNICDDILVSRKEELSNSTGITIPASSVVMEDDDLSSSSPFYLM